VQIAILLTPVGEKWGTAEAPEIVALESWK
jgi:hypothetical protein